MKTNIKNKNSLIIKLFLSLICLITNVIASPQEMPSVAPEQTISLRTLGWTDFPVSKDARIVYLSEDGNETNSGLTIDKPKLLPASAYALLRHGYPDRLKIKRNSTFFGSFGHWKKSGRSPAEPMVIETYGKGSRPVFKTGNSTFLFTSTGNNSPPTIDYLAILDIEATAQNYTGTGSPVGLSFLNPSNSITIEGCRFTNFEVGIVFTFGRPTGHVNLAIRRNDCSNCFATNGTVGHGIYVAAARGKWRIEENICDSNGLNPQSVFRHGFYMPEGSDGTHGSISDNISSRNAATGFNLRCGGKIHNNLSLQNSVAFFVGGWNAEQVAAYSPNVQWNVVLDGKDIANVGARGHAITMSKWLGGKFKYNIFAHQVLGTAPIAWTVDAFTFSNVDISDNIWYRWEGGSSVRATADQLTGTSINRCSWDLFTYKNDFILSWSNALAAKAVTQSANRFFRLDGNNTPIYSAGSKSITDYGLFVGDALISNSTNKFPAPERNIITYMQEKLNMPNATLADFIIGARENCKGDWDPAFTANAVNEYIREGFELKRKTAILK